MSKNTLRHLALPKLLASEHCDNYLIPPTPEYTTYDSIPMRKHVEFESRSKLSTNNYLRLIFLGGRVMHIANVVNNL